VHLRQPALLAGACLIACYLVPASSTEQPAAAVILRWDELAPDRANAFAAPPAPVHDYLSGESGPAAQQSLDFTVNRALEGQTVAIPGFIVPLDLDPSGSLAEFLLVPYVGACIHVPPPPPNQVVLVTLRQHIAPVSPYSAFWVTGRMEVSTTHSALAITAYTLRAESIRPYEQPAAGSH
jgi:uncharacterized protein